MHIYPFRRERRFFFAERASDQSFLFTVKPNLYNYLNLLYNMHIYLLRGECYLLFCGTSLWLVVFLYSKTELSCFCPHRSRVELATYHGLRLV